MSGHMPACLPPSPHGLYCFPAEAALPVVHAAPGENSLVDAPINSVFGGLLAVLRVIAATTHRRHGAEKFSAPTTPLKVATACK